MPALEPGIYSNFFPVHLPPEPVAVLSGPLSSGTILRDLRQKYAAQTDLIRFYLSQSQRRVLAYGSGVSSLSEPDFVPTSVDLSRAPDFARRVISDGVYDTLRARGYQVRISMGRILASEVDPVWVAPSSAVAVFIGFDIGVNNWKDPSSQASQFGLAVDVKWSVRDDQGRPLSPRHVDELGATLEVARAQGEFLPGSTRINTEIARQRLVDQILPFVGRNREIDLPTGGAALVDPDPVRVVLGA